MIVCAGEVKTKVPTFEFCCHLAEFILYEMDYKWDKIILYFNEYENAVRSAQRQAFIYRSEISQIIADIQFPTYEIEGDTRTIIDNLIEYKLASSLYMYMAENVASENESLSPRHHHHHHHHRHHHSRHHHHHRHHHHQRQHHHH